MLKVCYVKKTPLTEIAEWSADNTGPFYIYSQQGLEEDIIIFSEKELTDEEIVQEIDKFLIADKDDLIISDDDPIFEDGDDYGEDDLILLG